MNKLLLTCLTVLLFTTSGFAQAWELGGEYQHGFGKNLNDNIFGVRYESFSNKSSFGIGLTYRIAEFSKEGKHAEDNGFGLYADYRYAFSAGTSGNVFGGIKTALTFGKSNGEKRTDFIPALETGYHYTFNNFGSGGFATPSLTAGYDFGIGGAKDPHDTPIISPGIAVGYRF